MFSVDSRLGVLTETTQNILLSKKTCLKILGLLYGMEHVEYSTEAEKVENFFFNIPFKADSFTGYSKCDIYCHQYPKRDSFSWWAVQDSLTCLSL